MCIIFSLRPLVYFIYLMLKILSGYDFVLKIILKIERFKWVVALVERHARSSNQKTAIFLPAPFLGKGEFLHTAPCVNTASIAINQSD